MKSHVERTTDTEPGLRCLQCEPSKFKTKFFSSFWNLESIIGMQGRPPQNITQWHIDYFELKSVELMDMDNSVVIVGASRV